jgi:hypothetical protein
LTRNYLTRKIIFPLIESFRLLIIKQCKFLNIDLSKLH